MPDPEVDDAISPALQALLLRCSEKVRIIGRSMRLAPHTVDELFQEVRIRVWRAVKSGERIEGLPASYVYQTAMSAALDLARRRRSRRESDARDLTAASHLADRSAAADLAVERSELRAGLERALAELGETRRPVVRLYLSGYTEREIARLLGWTEAKTRNLLYRGLADLRAILPARGIVPREGP
jgi:RNA polymerase sigma factor (sigma-70 family)